MAKYCCCCSVKTHSNPSCPVLKAFFRMAAQSASTASQSTNIEAFSAEVSAALQATQDLQDNVHKLLHSFTTWNGHESESSLAKVRDTIKDIQSCQSKVEKTSATFAKLPDTKPAALGNSGLISLDPGEDKSTIYQDLLQAYDFVAKLNSDASNALKCLKRKYPEPEVFPFESAKKPRDTSKFLHELVPILQAHNPHLIIHIGDKRVPCLKVTIKGVFCAFIILNGCSLDRVIVRSESENTKAGDCLDSWTPSKYIVFRKTTDVCQSALLTFYSPVHFMRAAKSFVKWLSSYKGLFSEKCEHCKKHLKVETKDGHLLPPCWRDTLTNNPYHTTCR